MNEPPITYEDIRNTKDEYEKRRKLKEYEKWLEAEREKDEEERQHNNRIIDIHKKKIYRLKNEKKLKEWKRKWNEKKKKENSSEQEKNM